MSDATWIVLSPAPAGVCDGIGDYAARLAGALVARGRRARLIVQGRDPWPPASGVAGVLQQYSPSVSGAGTERWLDAMHAAGRPVMTTVHEYWPPATRDPRRVWRRWQLRRRLATTADRATALVLTQEIGRREIEASGVHGGTPVVVVPVGSNITPASDAAPHDGGVVVFGQPAAIQMPALAAVAQWLATQVPPVTLTWIGRSSEELAQAWSQIAGQDRAHVTLLGAAPEAQVSEVLSRAALGLAPYADGVSARRTTLAALLQHGVPTVALTGPATDSWLAASPGLEAVPQGDPAAFVAAVAAVWHDPVRRPALGRHGRALYDAHMSWPRIAAAYERLMDGVLT